MVYETNGPGSADYISPRFLFNTDLNIFTDLDGNPADSRNYYARDTAWRDANGFPVPPLDAGHHNRAVYDALPDDQARFDYVALAAHHTPVTDPAVQAMLHFYLELSDPSFPITPAERTAFTRDAGCDPYTLTDEALTHRPLIRWRELPEDLFPSAEDATLYNSQSQGMAGRIAEFEASSSTLNGPTLSYTLKRATQITLHPNPPEQMQRPDYPRQAQRRPVPGLPYIDGRSWAYNFNAEHVRWVLAYVDPRSLPTYTPRLPHAEEEGTNTTGTRAGTKTYHPNTSLPDVVAGRFCYDSETGTLTETTTSPERLIDPRVTRQIAIAFVENGHRRRRILTPQQIALCLMTGQEPPSGVRIYFNDGDNSNLCWGNLSIGKRPTQANSKTPAKQRARVATQRAIKQKTLDLRRELTEAERMAIEHETFTRYGV